MINDFIAFSLPPILIASFAALACALPGNFLILRKQALIGDAISHVVLPGIVLAFLVSGSISTVPMLLGAAAATAVPSWATMSALVDGDRAAVAEARCWGRISASTFRAAAGSMDARAAAATLRERWDSSRATTVAPRVSPVTCEGAEITDTLL